MTGFLSAFRYQPIVGQPGRYALTQPLRYKSGSRFAGRIFTVPMGFQTDLATVPAALQWLWPPDGPYSPAAVLHDYLRRSRVVKKEVADYLFWEAMGTLKINPITRYLFYRFVLLMPRQK